MDSFRVYLTSDKDKDPADQSFFFVWGKKNATPNFNTESSWYKRSVSLFRTIQEFLLKKRKQEMGKGMNWNYTWQ